MILPGVRGNSPAAPRPGPHVDRLENGLTLVSIPLPDPGVVVLATIVRAGARNEAEPGTGALAQLMAHLSDRGPLRSPRGYAPDLLARMGARVERSVSDDATIRMVVFSGPENLEEVVRVEADRVINLEIEAGSVRREAAILEAEAGAPTASPDIRLEDELRRTAFLIHPYGRPAGGRRDDFLTLPERGEAALLFQKRTYAPDNVVLLAAGDFSRPRLLDLVRRAYAGWGKSGYEFEPPVEPMPEGIRRSRVAWPTPVLARLAMGFRIPAFSDREPDKAALDLLAAAAFSSSSPFYDRLVRREKACLSLGAEAPDRRDPYLFIIRAEAASEAALPAIEKAVLGEIERLKSDLIPAQALDAARSGRLGALRLAMETTEGTAAAWAAFIGLTGDPGSLTRWSDLFGRIGSLEVRDAARRHLKTSAAAVVTLAAGPPPAPLETAERGDEKADDAGAKAKK
jgi:predicted Zn-dependent peptidase